MKVIVGLGNPGSKYQGTRHNAGFMVLDEVSVFCGIPFRRSRFSASCGEGSWMNQQVLLLKPQTYMNLSGKSVAAAARFHKVGIEDIIVIHDDLDIPFGRIKLKEGGGHAGHNGLRSLISELGSGDFTRIRVGIGRPTHGDPVDFVLTRFTNDEVAILPGVLRGAVEAVEVLVGEGIKKAMTNFNNRSLIPELN